MAFETKVILSLLAERVAKAKDTKEAYNVIATAAGVEGMKLPPFEEAAEKNIEKES